MDRKGRPLTVHVTAANLHDKCEALSLIDDIPPIRGPRGRPRCHPHKVHGDKGYDFPDIRRGLRYRRIIPRIARRGVESSERLGRHRWVVERTFAWLHRFKRLRIREERHGDIHLTLLELGCCLILYRDIEKHF